MAKVHFYYSAMNAGKSSTLLQANYNYHERGMRTRLFLPKMVHSNTEGYIASRIGIKMPATAFDHQFNFFEFIQNDTVMPNCLLIDEAQFMTQAQVKQVCRIADQLDIPILAYGLRSDFQAQAFEGSQYLLVLADVLIEIKTICFCGKKATMNLRIDEQGCVIRDGAQVEIGGNERYLATCRQHFFELKKMPETVLKHQSDLEICLS
jgi:thymidine kinase